MEIKEIIIALKEVDGETMEYILREIGMEDQMLSQLIKKKYNEVRLNNIEDGYGEDESNREAEDYIIGLAIE